MIGRVIHNRYRILELIGSGGMANVYTALDMQTKHTVAVKALKDEYVEDAEFVRRFQHEAKSVLMLSHDNIVRSIDIGEEDGIHYIVLEYVEGKSLKEMIREGGPMDPRKAIHIATQVCDALTHAHERQIIHRDVKSQNILVNTRGKARLTDFGIARDASASTMTFTGNSIMGSVHYLSPEQARGEPVDAQSDIYSLGITLYEMVVGAVPFEADSSVSVALKHLNESITPPKEILPEIPRSLNDIILRATQKDKALRYPTARVMKANLLRALREPEGRFAEQTMLMLSTERKPKRGVWGILRLALGAIVAVGLFTVMFFIGRSLITPNPQRDVIPKLTGMTLNAAINRADRLGYSVEVVERVIDEIYAKDIVIAQQPVMGASARKGEIIYVTLSDGPTQIRTPDLYGLSLDDAKKMLEVEGLTLGEKHYEPSDMPEGYIFRQDPAADEVLINEDTVDIWISGDPEDNIEMPSLTDLILEDAILDAQAMGFSQFLVYQVQTNAGEQENVVVSQDPPAGEPTPSDMLIVLWARTKVQQDYVGDIAFNLEVESNDSQVMIILVENADLRYVVYENTLSAGKQTIPLTIERNDGNEKAVIVYVNDVEVKRDIVTFTRRR